MKKELKMPVPPPFPATITLMEQRSVSADDDEDEDSLVKLCGIVHERDHDQEEFSDDEPPEPPQAFAGTAASTSEDSFEEDQEFLELQEREQIVDKYERGPDQKDVDPWENPDFELYRITDRYGFMHKKLTLEQTEEQKRVHKELRREQKWLRMLKEWEQRHPAKLAERMWKGVPDTLRLVIWKRLIGADVMKANSRDNLYNELLARARLVSKDIKQIDLDINRTYRDNLAFRRRYDVKQRSLFNVLTAYAMLNTEVGYCQGMSQIAALFLMYMDEEEAFWSLHGLLVNRKYGMHGFFVPGFPKLQRFQNHYDKVVLKYLPRVKRHLDNMGIPPIYLTKWWFGCFLDRVPFPLALRLWDVFLYFGESILIAMAYNIVKMHRKRIVRLSVEDFMEFIQTSLANDFGFTDDAVMESLGECLKRLQNDRMAIPAPPNPNATAELPTKPLGPILTRSMMDIRSDIDSVYSRCSRANSVTGRSPMVRRHHTQHIPPANHQKIISALASSRLQQQQHQSQPSAVSASIPSSSAPQHGDNAGGSRPGSLKLKDSRLRGTAADNMKMNNSHCADATTSTSYRVGVENATSSAVVGPPVEPFLRRVGSTKHRIQRPPPVPDEDGFVRVGPRGAKQKLQQDEQYQQHVEEGGAVHVPVERNNSLSTALHHRQHCHYDNTVPQSLLHKQQFKPTTPGMVMISGLNNSNNDGGGVSRENKKVPLPSKLPQPRSSSLKSTPSITPQQQRQVRRGEGAAEHRSPQLQHQHEQQLFGVNMYPAPEHRQQRSEGDGISGGRHRVHRAANNVTYISVEAENENASALQQQQQQDHHNYAPLVAAAAERHHHNDHQRFRTTEEKERVPSRLPYYCPPPDYDGEENISSSGRGGRIDAVGGSPSCGSNGGVRMANRMTSALQQQRHLQQQQQRRRRSTTNPAAAEEERQDPLAGTNGSRTRQPSPMAKPLYAHDETRVVRRF